MSEPWAVEDIGGCFVVKASNDRPLVFIYYGEGVARFGLSECYLRAAARTFRLHKHTHRFHLTLRVSERAIIAKRSIDDTGWKRLKADMIAGPAWMLDSRSFVAATGAALASA